MAFTDRISDLTEEELAALTRAGTWYANYFAHEVAAEADETHAYAVDERRVYLALVEGLRKMGVRFALPDELQDLQRQAA